MKPVLIWSTHDLNGGWVLICVDVSLEQPGQPEALLGYRRAVHPHEIAESACPVIAFWSVISEMTNRINNGLMGNDAANWCLPRVRARLRGEF